MSHLMTKPTKWNVRPAKSQISLGIRWFPVTINWDRPQQNQTRAVSGSDYSPATALSEEKDKLVTENWKDREKKYPRIIPNPHAHLHSMQKTSAKFQNNLCKTVRGVAPTRYPLSIHFASISYKNQKKKKETKFTKQKKWEKIKYYTKTICISSFHAENICKVSRQSVENCKRNCAPQGTHYLYTSIALHVKKATKFTKQKKWEQIKYYTQTTCTSSFHAKNICKVSKQLKENCKRSCTHKVPTAYTLW